VAAAELETHAWVTFFIIYIYFFSISVVAVTPDDFSGPFSDGALHIAISFA